MGFDGRLTIAGRDYEIGVDRILLLPEAIVVRLPYGGVIFNTSDRPLRVSWPRDPTGNIGAVVPAGRNIAWADPMPFDISIAQAQRRIDLIYGNEPATASRMEG